MAPALDSTISMAARETMLPSAVTFDIARMAIGPNGVDPFFWPVPRAESEGVRNAFLSALADAGRAHVGSGDPAAHLLEIAGLRWVTMVTRAFQAWAAIDRCRRAGVDVRLGERMSFARGLLAGEALPDDPYVTALVKGPPKRPLWQAIGSDVKGRLRHSPLRLRSFWRSHMREAVVSCATGPLLTAQARRNDKPVYYLPHSVWYGPLSADDVSGTGTHDRLAEAGVAAARAAFTAAGEELPGAVRAWLKRQFAISLAALALHFDRLTRHPDRLPVLLWTGANGNPFTRLLRRAVKQTGGTVVGHDHGLGTGAFHWAAMPLLEFIDCDRFVTFTDAHVATLAQVPGTEWMLQPRRPQIVAAEESTIVLSGGSKADKLAEEPHRRKRILYMDPRFYGDRGHFVAWRSDIVLMDWIARLIAKLQSWDFDVVYKAHPETPTILPQQVRDALGVEVISVPFDRMDQQYDLVLFDDPHSTTFPSALASEKDVVLIDVGFMPWASGAKSLLDSRCPIVASRFDAENRLQVDWDALREALRTASSRRDHRFLQTYFGSDSSRSA